jgi:hypothetical protein
MRPRLKKSKSGCWLWNGAKDSGGYGTIKLGMKRYSTHRLIFILFNGFIPKKMQLDHLCRVRNCANPAHLEIVTPKENVLRGNGIAAQNARKTHCKWGHPLSKENTYCEPGKTFRRCRMCMIRRTTEWRRCVLSP